MVSKGFMQTRSIRLAAAAAALLLATVPLAPPAATQVSAVARNIDVYACPASEVPEVGFADTQGTTFQREIGCVVWYGVSAGQNSTSYAPAGTVSRIQMATFVRNLIDYVDADALAAGDDGVAAFPCASDPDELAGDVHAASIELLDDAGIVRGGPAGLPSDCFGPHLTVTRAQMATFITEAVRFVDAALGGPTADYFDDDDGGVHEASINQVASEGIVVGTASRSYRPGAEIRRGQMAAYLARTLDYLVASGVTERPLSAGTGTAAAAEQRLVELINQERSNAGLGTLAVHPDMTAVARNWSAGMAGTGGACGSSGSLRHDPDYAAQLPGGWTMVAENVACAPSADSAHDVLMSSPTHRENILAPGFTHVGVGVTAGPDGTLWVTQNFAQY